MAPIKSREHKKRYEIIRNREAQTSKITNYFTKLKSDQTNMNKDQKILHCKFGTTVLNK